MDELIELLHALARCEHSDTSIAEDAADALEAAQTENERLREALKDIWSRSSMNLAMSPNPFTHTAILSDTHQIAGAALAQENKA